MGGKPKKPPMDACEALDLLGEILEEAGATVTLYGKVIASPEDARKRQLIEAMHPDWVVLRWNSINERNYTPSILYAVIGDGFAVVNNAWYHETAGWCPHGGTATTMRTADVASLLKTMLKDGGQ